MMLTVPDYFFRVREIGRLHQTTGSHDVGGLLKWRREVPVPGVSDMFVLP